MEKGNYYSILIQIIIMKVFIVIIIKEISLMIKNMEMELSFFLLDNIQVFQILIKGQFEDDLYCG